MRARGVDISRVQEHCNFVALAAGGYDFVIPKCSEGVWRDRSYESHVTEARRAGLLVPMAYHVLSPHTPIEKQVRNAVEQCQSYDLEVCLDFEVMGCDAIQALQFADGVISAGRKCVVYSYPNFTKGQKLASMMLLAQRCDYFTAAYVDEKHQPPDSAHPWVPPVWASRNPPWRFWQWSGNGGTSAPGIPQVVDHVLYNGTLGDLGEWMTVFKGESIKNDPTT